MREKTVIVVMSTSPARAAKQATSIIPSPTGSAMPPTTIGELVVSLARPASLHFGILLHTRNAQWKAC